MSPDESKFGVMSKYDRMNKASNINKESYKIVVKHCLLHSIDNVAKLKPSHQDMDTFKNMTLWKD